MPIAESFSVAPRGYVWYYHEMIPVVDSGVGRVLRVRPGADDDAYRVLEAMISKILADGGYERPAGLVRLLTEGLHAAGAQVKIWPAAHRDAT